jgi:pimeloyl-ACP methyl ester carboxylesterase
MAEPRFHALPDGRRLAYRLIPGSGPALLFLPGYMSDMAGSKATALAEWAAANGRCCVLLDYSGCGESEGDFADGTLSRWTEEALALIDAHLPGNVVLVGSSMGGWLMLLAGLALGSRLAGLVGIAAAPDFTEWGYSAEEKAQLARSETVLRDNPYGPEPTPMHAGFWHDGQLNRLLDGAIALTCPVRLLHGQDDADVPVATSFRLASALDSTDVQVTIVKGGDHRLSRPGDIALLLSAVASIA